MRQLTPLGYLKPYIHYLSYCRSMSLKKLAVEAGTDNYRLKGPFMLYVVFSDNQTRLLKILQSDYYKEKREERIRERLDSFGNIGQYIQEFDFYQYCVDFFSKYNKDNIITFLETHDEPLDAEKDKYGFYYHKCWTAYKCDRDAHKRDMRVSSQCCKRVKEYQEKYGITNSQIYNDLGLNAGNVNAWLNYDKPTIGRKTAMRIFEYCEKIAKEKEVKNNEEENN